MNKNQHNCYEIQKSKTCPERMASHIKLEESPLPKFQFNMCHSAPEAIVIISTVTQVITSVDSCPYNHNLTNLLVTDAI